MQPDVLDLSSEMFPVLWVLRLLGTAPLSFTPIPGGHRISISRLWAIYGCVITILYGLLHMINFVLTILNEWESDLNYFVKVSTMLRIFQFMLTYYIVGMAAFTAPQRIKQMMFYMKSIQEINKNISYDYASGKKKIWLAWSIILYVISGTAMLFVAHLVLRVDPKISKKASYLSSYFCGYLVYCLVALLKYHIVFIMLSIMTTLRAINRDLSIHLMKPKGTSREFSTIIHKYSYLYNLLREVILQVNESEGSLYFVLFVQNFIILAVTTYNMGVVAKAGSMGSTILECAWLSFVLSHVLIIIEACHRVKNEMDKTKYILCKIVSVIPANKQLMKETENFLQQLSLDQDVFSPLGVFSLTRSLIVTTLSIITTFVIMLIQFKLLDD